MTLGGLRKLLATYDHLPDDTLVALQKDAEGNGYSPLEDVMYAVYVHDSTWYGDVYPSSEEIATREDLSEEDEAPDEAVPCIVLWPVN